MAISDAGKIFCFSKEALFMFMVILSLCTGTTTLIMTEAKAGDEAPQAVNLVYDRAEALLKRYYPGISIQRTEGRFVANYDTRKFMIHHALKTGEWQEAREQEGPNRGGVICSIQSQKGRWGGAAVVPQTFNSRYFESLLMAPYSKALDRHLVVHLDYPDSAKPEFLKELQTLISAFAEQ